MNTINVGVIGMGKMGILHTGILSALDGVKIIAVAEKDDTLRNYLGKILSHIRIYDDYVDMLDKESIDLVYITTPVSLHASMINDCVRHSNNFFVEKPLARSMKECVDICTKLRNNNVIHAVGYSKRFVDTFVKAKDIITNNVLGELMYVKGTMYLTQIFAAGKGWRLKSESGGGVLLELASHLVDMLLWYFGNIREVVSITKNYYGEVEDFAHAILKFDNGLIGYLDTSWSVRNYRLPEINIEVHGSNGTMIVNDDYIRITLDNAYNNNIFNIKDGTSVIYKQDLFKGVPIDIGGVEYTREDLHVIQCVRDKKQSMINVFEASKTQAVIDAIYNSAKDNKWIKVNYIG